LALIRSVAALLLVSLLTGCIILPHGHHRHRYHRDAVIVVPAEAGHPDSGHYPPRRGRY
jgi:hypothetical protein